MKKYRKIVKIGNSIGIILPRTDYEYKDLEVGEWVEITVKPKR